MDKTSVINPSVSESGDQESAQELEGEKAPSELESTVRGQVKKEYARKDEEYAERFEKYENQIAELTALVQSTSRPASSDDQLERQIEEIEKSPQYRPFNTKLERLKTQTMEAAQQAAAKAVYSEMLMDAIHTECDRHNEAFPDEKETPKELTAILNNMLTQEEKTSMGPIMRFRAVLRRYRGLQSQKRAMKKLEDEVASRNGGREGKGRLGQDKALSFAEAQKTGDLAAQLRALGKL